MILESKKQIINFVNEYKKTLKVKINKSKFSNLKSWEVRDKNIRHSSGGFFSIIGLDVKTNYGNVFHWQQPIILLGLQVLHTILKNSWYLAKFPLVTPKMYLQVMC